jgi:hypothetical protein
LQDTRRARGFSHRRAFVRVVDRSGSAGLFEGALDGGHELVDSTWLGTGYGPNAPGDFFDRRVAGNDDDR